MIASLCLILMCQLAGEIVVRALALPMPGPVVGMLLLLILLPNLRQHLVPGAKSDLPAIGDNNQLVDGGECTATVSDQDNDAAALCRVSTARDCWPVSVAAGPIVMASRFFGVVSCRLAISAIVGSR